MSISIKSNSDGISGAIQVNGIDSIPFNASGLVNPSANRNRMINGNMSIDQRNSGAAQTITAASTLAYTVDRWYAYCTGTNVTGQQVATGTNDSKYKYQFTGAASVTGIGFAQRIEAANTYPLAGQTVTLSAEMSNSLLTSVTWAAYYATTTDTFGTLASPTKTLISTGTFTVSSTDTKYSTQIAIPSGATTGIEIVFSVGAQTSGTWSIENVQLELGSIATPIENRLYGAELALCQRYTRILDGLLISHVMSSSNLYNPTVTFATMRVPPTFSNASYVAGSGSAGTVNLYYTTPTSMSFNNSANNWTINAYVLLTATLSAEL
jgi:hypothetical protein